MEKTKTKYDLVIIGGGSCGLASAISAFDNGVKDILVLEKDNHLGGILNQCIHNGFGLHEFKEELTGPEYAYRFINQLLQRKIPYKLNTMVTKLEKIDNEFEIYYSNDYDGYVKLEAKCIITSTGCSERTRGNIAIQGSRPSGVMTAGMAQKYLNIEGYLVGKRVFILGSGDIGLIMARRMTLEGAKVLGVAELMPYSNGLNRNIVQCLEDFNIPLYLSHTVKKIIGKNRLEKVIISKVDEKFNFIEGEEKEFEVDTLLLSVGLIPSNPLLEELNVKIHPSTKGPIVDNNLQTSVEGLFSCGNSLHVHDLVDFVTIEGRRAGLSASLYLEGRLSTNNNITLVNGSGIGYVLPNSISNNNSATIKFRVKKPFGKCIIRLTNNGKLVKDYKKLYLLPAEMVNIELDAKSLEEGELKIEVIS